MRTHSLPISNNYTLRHSVSSLHSPILTMHVSFKCQTKDVNELNISLVDVSDICNEPKDDVMYTLTNRVATECECFPLKTRFSKL